MHALSSFPGTQAFTRTVRDLIWRRSLAPRTLASRRAPHPHLFADSDAGAERAACVYTLVATCVLAGVDPWAYLTDVLEKLAQGWPRRRLEELLPPMWKAARDAASQASAASPATT